MIKFGISKNYIPNWDVVNGIREIYQNFIDYGKFHVDIIDLSNDKCIVKIQNSFEPNSWEFLKIGFTDKNENDVGGHGEGLKLAGLIFARENLDFKISCKLGIAKPIFYDDENIGECYGLDIIHYFNDKFEIEFECNKSDISVFKESYIRDKDIKYSCFYGDIVDKPIGNIYIGRLFVCNMTGFKYAFNFKPEFISLSRDRDMPSTWDMEYYSNQIVLSCSNDIQIRASDINKREFNAGQIPDKLAEKFKPEMKGNKMIMKSGNTIVTDNRKINSISKNKKVAKRIAKLRYQAVFISKKSPSTILTELKNEFNLNNHEKAKFDAVIKISKNWKQI